MASNRKFNVPINLLNLSSDPASADEGDIYYNTTDDVVRVYANGAWTTIGSGGGSSTLDGLTDVTITSTTDNEVLAYDNGTSTWINQTASEAGLVAGVGTNKISYQTTEPSTPSTGDVWIDSDGSTAEVNGIPPALSMVSTYYYTAPGSNSSVAATLNLVYFLPLIVAETTTFDRIATRTGASFSGSGVVRLGIYDDSGGQPSTVVLDAGTVATSASNTAYEITISQTLSAGIYWLAFVSQTNATTNNYRTSITAYYQTAHGTNTGGGGQAIGWTQSGVSGAFATASVSGASYNTPTVWLRKE
jgi:hypothetical protein